MRTRRKQSINGTKVVAICLTTVVIVAGAGIIVYKGSAWAKEWFPPTQTKVVAPIMVKVKHAAPVKIQNVSAENFSPIVQVTGTVELDEQAQSFFNKLNNWEFLPQKQFGFNEWFASIEQQLTKDPSEDTYSYLASLLYEASMKSGFEAGERHLHQQLPVYASPGFDAFVTIGHNGLTLYNPKDASAVVHVSYSNKYPVLTMTAKTSARWNEAESSIKQTHYAPEQVEIADGSLSAGSQATRKAGKAGLLAEVTVDGKTISRDFYLPEPAIIGKGPKIIEKPAGAAQ